MDLFEEVRERLGRACISDMRTGKVLPEKAR